MVEDDYGVGLLFRIWALLERLFMLSKSFPRFIFHFNPILHLGLIYFYFIYFNFWVSSFFQPDLTFPYLVEVYCVYMVCFAWILVSFWFSFEVCIIENLLGVRVCAFDVVYVKYIHYKGLVNFPEDYRVWFLFISPLKLYKPRHKAISYIRIILR